MILAIDTSSAACTAALFDGSGACIDFREEIIGRGHSERLVPMLADMLDGRRPDQLLIGVGPGSFTGIRVGIAAAHGMAIGWGIRVAGLSSLALLAAGTDGSVAAAVRGGHGELFLQQFDGLDHQGEMLNLSPEQAATAITAPVIVGSGAAQLVEARGWGEAIDRNPSATNAMMLPAALRELAPAPLYARAPDARPRVAA